MNFFKKFLAILQMAAGIIPMVLAVESAIPGAGHGPTKLNLVLSVLGTAVGAAPDIQSALAGSDVNALATSIISGVVSTLNAAGVFTKTPPTA